jgi:YjbE family integral membrane protein
VIGLAAAGLPAHQRGKAVLFGVVAAAVLRIIFSIFATKLLELWWIDIVGGLALLYIAYGFFRELMERKEHEGHEGDTAIPDKTLMQALWQIVIADVSMSLDNVLAVAGAAHGHPTVLIIGLILSIALMGLAATFIANLLNKHRWIAYIGLLIILYVALKMMWEGWHEVQPMVMGMLQ